MPRRNIMKTVEEIGALRIFGGTASADNHHSSDDHDDFLERLTDAVSRRSFLKATAAAGGLAGLPGLAAAHKNQITLYCSVPGWRGVEPESIEGQNNPTLEVEAGETYTITWVNVDGKTHNLVIVDDEGYQLLRTDLEPEQGAVQTVQFEATSNMGQYFCEVHPRSMRGDFENVGDDDGAPPVERGIPAGATVELEEVANGLTHPLGLEVPPGDDERRFVLDQTGEIHVLTDDGLQEELFLDVSDRLYPDPLGAPELGGYDERGLLGLAFHPEFQENGRFFVRYSAPVMEGTPEEYDHTEVLSEFQATEDLSTGDPASEQVLLTFPSPQLNHNAGQIAFGPEDGYLYVPMGDGGGADDTGLGHVEDWYDVNAGGNGQDVTENRLGAIHRIDVDTEGDGEGNGEAYGIPDDNPLVDADGFDEHYAWGFRNPWRVSFNDGELFVGDLGQNLFEEVDIVEKGGNYGWNVREGTHCFSTDHPTEAFEGCPMRTPDDVRGGEALIDPIIEYEHRKTTTAVIDGNAVIGGYVYGTLPGETFEVPDELAALDGKYVFGNWSNRGFLTPAGAIFAATPPEGHATEDGDDGSDGDGGENGEGGDRGDGDDGENAADSDDGENTADSNDDRLWSLEQLQVAGREGGELGEYVMSFGRGNDGELYVLTTMEAAVEGDTGKVYRIAEATGESERTEEEEGAEEEEGTEEEEA